MWARVNRYGEPLVVQPASTTTSGNKPVIPPTITVQILARRGAHYDVYESDNMSLEGGSNVDNALIATFFVSSIGPPPAGTVMGTNIEEEWVVQWADTYWKITSVVAERPAGVIYYYRCVGKRTASATG